MPPIPHPHYGMTVQGDFAAQVVEVEQGSYQSVCLAPEHAGEAMGILGLAYLRHGILVWWAESPTFLGSFVAI